MAHSGDSARFALLSIEHIGMTVAHTDALRAAVAAEIGLSPTQVMITFTHTHSAPDTDSDSPLSTAYRESLLTKACETVRSAVQKMQPCTLGWGVTTTDIGVNRRERDAQGRARQGIHPTGPVDRRVGLLSIHHAQSGTHLGLIVICTAHGNILRGDNLRISGDFPGWTRARLRASLNCPVVVLIGSAGDCNPRWRGTVEDLERTRPNPERRRAPGAARHHTRAVHRSVQRDKHAPARPERRARPGACGADGPGSGGRPGESMSSPGWRTCSTCSAWASGVCRSLSKCTPCESTTA
ncbi:MAG: hypothetical protein K8J31_19900 [Anaerolineae bacterium]|nr:hypothetical protein [Anaerolineae bacterium]